MWRLFSILLLLEACCSSPALDPGSLLSAHAGDGLYTYTFDRGDLTSHTWGFRAGPDGVIFIQSFEVVEVRTPPAWTSSVSSNGLVTFYLNSGPVYLDDAPVSFSIRSASSTASNYPLSFACSLFAGVYVAGSHEYVNFDGYQQFQFVGPEPVIRMRIAPSGTNVVLRWPVTANRYVLETTTNLRPGTNVWSAVPEAPTVVGWNKFLTNAVSGSHRCYRLRRE